MKMLIVDDDPLYRKVHAGFARQFDHAPIVASDGEEGWAAFQQHRPYFVLLDWMMPRLNGLDLCKRIRAADVHVRPYVILVTTLSDTERVLEGFDAGADDYIAKPFDKRIFESHAKAALERLQWALKREEILHRRVIENFQEAVGHENPKLLGSLDALAEIYGHQGSYAKARGFLRRQIAIAKNSKDEVTVRRLEAAIASLNREEQAASSPPETSTTRTPTA